MTKDGINKRFENNKPSSYNVLSVMVEDLMEFVRVELKIDEESLEYYYEIDVDELSKSKIPDEEIEILAQQGWALSNNKEKLILFLTVF